MEKILKSRIGGLKVSSTRAEMLEAARGYTMAGLIIQPLRKPQKDDKKTGKAPIEEAWQNRQEPRSEADLVKFWGKETSSPYNIGLQCGKRSGITVMDIDDYNPAILNDLFEGMSKENLTISRRTPERGHLYFKYTGDLQAVKKHFIEIEILNNGSNAVLPPSVHYSGSAYKMNRKINSIDDFPAMPDELISRIKELFNTSDKLEAILNKCRKCIREKFTELKDEKNAKFYHTSTGRDFTLALMIELHANGAGEKELLLACKIIFREDYTLDKSKKELNYVLNYANDGGKPWTCETIQSKCNVITIGTDGNSVCETCKPRGEEYKKKAGNGKGKQPPKKIKVFFDEVGERVLKNDYIFSMRDNGQIYLYRYGVYRSEGAEAILGTQIRNTYKLMFMEKWKEENPDHALPEHIPKATAKYVNEVLEYIRAYTHRSRDVIDFNQDRYINFKNGLFDLVEWRLVSHDPKILNIAQVPVTYNPNAKCPEITGYLASCRLPTERITVLEEFAGYCLTTDVRLQKAVMLYGKGSNGKSVFINLVKAILGKEYVSGESLHNLENDKYRVANLYGKRLNAFPDLKDSPLQTNEVFNTLTGNDSELTGERKYQRDFSFKPTAKLLFSANKIPFAYSDNYAYYRRWILVEFPYTFEKDEIDENILEKLTTENEKSGFINLMLEGLKRLLKNRRFSYDLGVDEIEKQYLLHSDNVTVFEEECLRDCSGNEEPTEKNQVYKFYETWCKQNNLIPTKPKTFTKKLDKIGRKVYNTTKYNPDTKKSEWRSCYFNTVVDFNSRKR